MKKAPGHRNFGKLLIGKEGRILWRFDPETKPDAPELVEGGQGH
jgi:glutathione peroxidase-family protein